MIGSKAILKHKVDNIKVRRAKDFSNDDSANRFPTVFNRKRIKRIHKITLEKPNNSLILIDCDLIRIIITQKKETANEIISNCKSSSFVFIRPPHRNSLGT